MMKGQLDRTKVVLRHLPPSISQAALVEQIDVFFAGRYNWVAFRPGKRRLGQKNQSYSRAYIDLKRPEDVFDFAEFFDGHLFVNEKGSQFKVIVEYAPSQRVPKHWSKKDGREGTIFKDPEYLEFLEFIAKPAENLPSAETQLERREAERSGAEKDVPIVTPLMDFVRQKRAAKAGSRRLLPNGKTSRRAGASSARSPTLPMTKRGSERKKNSASMYVVRDVRKNTSAKDKSTYTLVPKRNDQQPSEKSSILASPVGTQLVEEESGVSGADAGKKKVLLVKRKEKEISHVPANMSQQHSTYSKNMGGSVALKQNPRHHDNGRIIKSILLNKDACQSQSSGTHSEQQIQSSSSDRDKRLPRSQHVQLILKDTNGAPDHKIVGNDLHGSYSEKQEKRTRNKDRPDRGVWTPLNRLDGSSASDESLSSAFQPDHSLLDSSEGSHKHHGRRGATHGVKDLDGSPVAGEGKHSKRGYGSHEKQVWVQKSSSGS
ncbi:regulator of nonsense transcripts UPF3-like isoform X1 [Malus sylvestris]|uniref:regulator of nonsense transcripts UPF3-like isoform X1 n=1 Tax=Malus sylvestris TaxID=3752 RepID=UPI0021ACB55F|nr:regulator of nonsense transcripts UPF3-like isoform X1 [Malus sylvestris]